MNQEIDIIKELAQNPQSSKYSWQVNIRPAIEKYLESFEFNDLKIYLENFCSSPFTIQRIAELLLNPNLYTHDRNKYKRALEKCFKVSTSIPTSDDMMEFQY